MSSYTPPQQFRTVCGHCARSDSSPSTISGQPKTRESTNVLPPCGSLHHLYQLTQCNCELSSRLRPVSPPPEACAAYAVATAAICSSCCIYKCMSYHLLPPLGELFLQNHANLWTKSFVSPRLSSLNDCASSGLSLKSHGPCPVHTTQLSVVHATMTIYDNIFGCGL